MRSVARTLKNGNDVFDEHFVEVHMLDHPGMNRIITRVLTTPHCKNNGVHLVCFIRNIYKERFLVPIKIVQNSNEQTQTIKTLRNEISQ